jgi:hypothetical protein
MHRCSFSRHTPKIADIAAAVLPRVAVEQLHPAAALRNTHPVRVARYWCEVANDQNQLARAAASHERDHAVQSIVGIDPFEAIAAKVPFVQCLVRPVQAIQIPDPGVYAGVHRVLQNVPFEARFVIPFGDLRDLGSHEKELLPGLCEHVAVEEAQICELAPLVPGHFPEQ